MYFSKNLKVFIAFVLFMGAAIITVAQCITGLQRKTQPPGMYTGGSVAVNQKVTDFAL